MTRHTQSENETILREFQNAVNMTAKELENWLETAESKSVGIKEHEDDESTGHQSDCYIVKLLHKQHSNYDEVLAPGLLKPGKQPCPHHGRFATARCPQQQHEVGLFQFIHESGDELIPTKEAIARTRVYRSIGFEIWF
jgi:hypothetical protein